MGHDPEAVDVSVWELVAMLQTALGVRVVCGQLTLNVSEGRLQSVETKTYQRVAPKVDKPAVKA